MKQPRLVFIPGWGMEEGVWDFLLSYFKEYSVQFVNWRDVKRHSDFAERVIEATKGQDVILIAWSLGALTALQVCNRVQGKGMVLIGGTAKFTVDEEYESGWKRLFVERMKRGLAQQKDATLHRFYKSMFAEKEREVREQFVTVTEQFQGDSTESLQLGLDYLIETDMRSNLENIKVPILLLHGEKDMVCPLSAARYIQENRNATLKVIKGAGHALCITDPKVCAAEIISFVRGMQDD